MAADKSRTGGDSRVKFELHRAESPQHAVDLAGALGPSTLYLAGGTDLIIQMRRGLRSADHIVDLSGIDSLRGISLRNDSVRIGALCTHKDIEKSELLRRHYPGLCAAAHVVGGHQIRNVGTVGGNIANASPAADVGTALLALDASVKLVGSAGRRSVDLDEFFVAAGKTVLNAGELIEAVEIPLPHSTSANAFIKVGRRKAMEISVVCVAVSVMLDSDERIVAARIALGSVGPRPLRTRAAESALSGRTLAVDVIQLASQLARQECSPRSDVRASAEYRRDLVEVVVSRALAQCGEFRAQSREESAA